MKTLAERRYSSYKETLAKIEWFEIGPPPSQSYPLFRVTVRTIYLLVPSDQVSGSYTGVSLVCLRRCAVGRVMTSE